MQKVISFFEQYFSNPKIPFLVYDYDEDDSSINLLLESNVKDFKLMMRHNGTMIELNSITATTLKIEGLESFLDFVKEHYLVNLKEK